MGAGCILTGAPDPLVLGSTRRLNSFTVQATDSSVPPRVSSPVQLSIQTRPPEMTYNPPALLAARVRQPYSANLGAPVGGTPPYHYQLDTMGGFPPFGITINPAGVISGIPVAAGRRLFRICAVDSTGDYACGQADLTVLPVVRRRLNIIRNGTGLGFVAVAERRAITAAEEWKVSAVSESGDINCGNTCIGDFDDGTVVTLTATAEGNSVFVGWGGDCSGTTACTITMNSDKNVTATFSVQLKTLTVIKPGDGRGSVTSTPIGIDCGSTCTSDFADRAPVVLTARADDGSRFTGWSGACTGTGSCMVTMDSNKTVTATFSLPAAKTLTITKSGNGTGTVTSVPAGINCGPTCQASFSDSTSVTLTAAATDSSTFTGWSGGDCTGTGPCRLTMDQNATVTATFTRPATVEYTLTTTVGGTGFGVVNLSPLPVSGRAGCTRTSSPCTSKYTAGTRVSLSLLAFDHLNDAGPDPFFPERVQSPGLPVADVTYRWTGACAGAGETCTVTMNADKQVGVTFTEVGSGGRFAAGFRATSSGRFDNCQIRHDLSGTIYLDFTGSGTSSDPYSGTMSGNGTDVLTVLSGRCFGDTISGTLTGTVSGSSGRVEAHGTVRAAGTVVYFDFTGTVSGRTLPGTLTIRNEFFSTITGAFSFDAY